MVKKIQVLLQSDLKNFVATMDESPDMICMTERCLATYINKNWLDFTGRRIEEELGDGRFDIIHNDERISTKETIKTALLKQIPYRVKYKLRHVSGSYKWVVEEGLPVFSSTGASFGYIIKCINIDNEKKLELQLQDAEEKYRRLFETAYDGILILDSKTGEITDVNPFLIELLGYSKEEFIGKKLWEVGPFKNAKVSKEAFRLVQEVGFVRYDDLPLESKGGELIAVEFVSNRYTAGDSSVIQCNIRDVSERKKAEEMEKIAHGLKQEKLKTAFIADITHELRTPLAIIKGNIELALRSKSKDSGTVAMLKEINNEVSHLAEILSDLVILTTKNQNYHKKVITKKINVSELITQTVERLKIISTPRHINLHFKEVSGIMIDGDYLHLKKLFSNVISNAIYYGKENGVVDIILESKENRIVITVTDDGIGIKEEDITNIFDRFYRSENARHVNQEGTGLGLAICKWIIEEHEGSIEVISTLNKGTTFVINLPFK